ncbi:MAG TPA: lipid-A-disaccharide synthase [Alphaproteobacteria bacterium]
MSDDSWRHGDAIFLIAGEPSGDALGAKLIAALKRAGGGRFQFLGVGGERMAAEGLTSLFPLTDIAVMGFTEVVPRLPVLLQRIRETADAIWDAAPAAVVTIDAPSFGLRVADRVRESGIPLIHYVAPQLWAWRPGRARRLARRVDHLLALLPFEPEFFKKLGVACTYVGHPVIEDALLPSSGIEFRARHAIPPEATVVLALPGSRIGLAQRMLPVFAAAIDRLAARTSNLHVVLPTVAGTDQLIRTAAAGWRVPRTVVASTDDKRGAFAAAAAALTVSGTATMELAVAGVPMVVAYRVGRLTEFLARRMIEVPHVAMPNLILGRAAVPELLQAECTPERLADALDGLIHRGGGAAQGQDLAEIRRRLGLDQMQADGVKPSDRAAAFVLDRIHARRAKT